MMKCIFVVVLLQVCHSSPLTNFTPDFNRNTEILNDLRYLKQNFSHPMIKSIPIPGPYMLSHPSKCVDVFSQKLGGFLKNMTLEGAVRATVEKLELMLELLARHRQANSNSNCTMIKANKTNPFKKHIEFIQKLNSRS